MVNLIPHTQFGKLRLHDFVPEGTEIGEVADWEWQGSLWHNEGIGFTSFSREASTPNQTGGLEVFFEELPTDNGQRIMSAIGLPLCCGMSAAGVLSVMGPPTETRQYAPDRRTFEFSVGNPDRYLISCTVHETRGLIFVSVIRADLVNREE